jgi:pimeloyl-ACP methyl ester carboxylesterase
LKAGWLVAAPDLRGTGETAAGGALGGAPDHTPAEQALWIGRPLLGQWTFDVLCLLDWLAVQPALDPRRVVAAGIGQAGLVALCAAGVLEERLAGALVLGGPVSYVTEEAYGPGTFMGLLAPGILKWADVPQLAALVAPRRLVLADGVTPQGKKLLEKDLREAYGFTADVYKVCKAEAALTLAEGAGMEDLVSRL